MRLRPRGSVRDTNVLTLVGVLFVVNIEAIASSRVGRASLLRRRKCSFIYRAAWSVPFGGVDQRATNSIKHHSESFRYQSFHR